MRNSVRCQMKTVQKIMTLLAKAQITSKCIREKNHATDVNANGRDLQTHLNTNLAPVFTSCKTSAPGKGQRDLSHVKKT